MVNIQRYLVKYISCNYIAGPSNDVRVSLLTRYECIQLNYKLYFREDIGLDSISNIPGVAELVDASDSRSDAVRRAGSSPVPGTFLMFLPLKFSIKLCFFSK